MCIFQIARNHAIRPCHPTNIMFYLHWFPQGGANVVFVYHFPAERPQRARLPIVPSTTLLPCLWSLKTFRSLPGSRLSKFYRGASSALLQLVNQWLNFTYLRSHAFCYVRRRKKMILTRIELTISVQVGMRGLFSKLRLTLTSICSHGHHNCRSNVNLARILLPYKEEEVMSK